jgi:predicted ABC-type ATPase
MKPKLIIVAGPNGSGKTTITEKLLRHEWMGSCEYINPDNIALNNFGDWNSTDSIIKAANYSQKIRENCLSKNESMAFETVFSSEEKVSFVKRAKSAGYFIRFFFICTEDPSINAQRVALRVMNGGHDVPISKIISRYYRSITNCSEISTLVDRSYFYDNSENEADPVLLFRIADGKVVKTYNNTISLWAKNIFDTLV